MAEMIIMLRRDPDTGKQNILVKLDSEPDVLPIEHEQMHRRLVRQLVGVGVDPDDLGELIIEREPETQANKPTTTSQEAQKKKAGQSG